MDATVETTGFWRGYRPALIAALVYLLLCVAKSGPGGLWTGHTWQGWADQTAYLRSARAFLHGDLSPDAHWYPLLYPLLAAPFLPVLPHDPFLPLDIMCVAATAQGVTRVGRRLGVAPGVALAALLLTALWPPELWQAWVQPWTTTLSAALLWLLMAEIGDAADAPTPRRAAWLGAFAALVPLVRPPDALVPLILVGWLVVQLARRRALSWRMVVAASFAAALPLIAYGLLHLAIYGARTTDYMRLSAAVGFSLDAIGWKAAALYLYPDPWFPGEAALLARMPWAALGLAGLVVVGARGDVAGRRGYPLALIAAGTVYVIMLTAYVDLLPTGLWRYNLIHYFKWLLPLLGIAAWRLLREWRAAPIAAAVGIFGTLAVTGLRVEAVPAAPREPARRVDFAAVPMDWRDLYFARSVVIDSRGTHHNIYDYHQIPDGARMRAIALRGEFAADPRWWGTEPHGTAWPAGAPAAGLAGNWPATPDARWKTAVRWGVPCWIAPCAAPR